MIRRWTKRATSLHDELAAIADVDPRWWLVAGAAAAVEPERARADYLISDAEPGDDTFIGYRAPVPDDPVADAITRARAAATALRELDGQLPDQPLSVTVRRADRSVTQPSMLDAAAFAIADRCLVAYLDDPTLYAQLVAVLGGAQPAPWTGPVPFVCVSIGDEPIETARHGHRRAWTESGGPWLGLGRTGELATVSTCHLVVDGYGHARLVGRIAELTVPSHRAAVRRRSLGVVEAGDATPMPTPMPLATATPPPVLSPVMSSARPNPVAMQPAAPQLAVIAQATAPEASARSLPIPTLVPVRGAIPLGVAWRELPHPAPRALPLAYALGIALHRLAGRPDARFSPTFQLPIAKGRFDEPERRRRRTVAGVVSVRFSDGRPEPYADFEARVRASLAREASGRGLVARLLAAVSALPAPLAWKRKNISAANRPRWVDRLAEVLGGRACLSRMAIDAPVPPSCAVSSPPTLAHERDPVGSCVVTIVDDGERAGITICGSGLAGTRASAEALLDELLP